VCSYELVEMLVVVTFDQVVLLTALYFEFQIGFHVDFYDFTESNGLLLFLAIWQKHLHLIIFYQHNSQVLIVKLGPHYFSQVFKGRIRNFFLEVVNRVQMNGSINLDQSLEHPCLHFAHVQLLCMRLVPPALSDFV